MKHLACNTGALVSSFFVYFANFSLIPFETFSPSPSGHNLCLHTHPVGRNELAKCGFGLTSIPPVPSPTFTWSSFSKNSECPLCFTGMCLDPSRSIAPALENPSFHGPHLDLTTCPSWPLLACLPLLIHSPACFFPFLHP